MHPQAQQRSCHMPTVKLPGRQQVKECDQKAYPGCPEYGREYHHPISPIAEHFQGAVQKQRFAEAELKQHSTGCQLVGGLLIQYWGAPCSYYCHHDGHNCPGNRTGNGHIKEYLAVDSQATGPYEGAKRRNADDRQPGNEERPSSFEAVCPGRN